MAGEGKVGEGWRLRVGGRRRDESRLVVRGGLSQDGRAKKHNQPPERSEGG